MADIFENLKKVLAHGFQYAVNQSYARQLLEQVDTYCLRL